MYIALILDFRIDGSYDNHGDFQKYLFVFIYICCVRGCKKLKTTEEWFVGMKANKE